ncbi:hypothetical protein COSO111634_24605 [Corallococcus soli]
MLGLAAGGLLTVGACLWLLMEPPSSQHMATAPRPIPFRPAMPNARQVPKPPEVKVEAVEKESPQAAPTASAPPAATTVLGKEAEDVSGMVKYVYGAKDDQIEAAVDMANLCKEKYPNNPECRELLQFALSRSATSREARQREHELIQGPPRRRVESRPAPKRAPGPASWITEIQTQVAALNMQGRPQEALKVAQACVDTAPATPECHLMLGVLYAKVQALDMSRQHYERFLALAPADHPRRQRVADILSDSRKAPATGSGLE